MSIFVLNFIQCSSAESDICYYAEQASKTLLKGRTTFLSPPLSIIENAPQENIDYTDILLIPAMWETRYNNFGKRQYSLRRRPLSRFTPRDRFSWGDTADLIMLDISEHIMLGIQCNSNRNSKRNKVFHRIIQIRILQIVPVQKCSCDMVLCYLKYSKSDTFCEVVYFKSLV